MSELANPGMDAEAFDQFLEQLERYVRERLLPAEKQVIADDRIPDEIITEMKDMGLFGLTVPEEYGGAGLNCTQYAKVVKTMAYAAPAYRSIFSINVGMFNSAIKNGGTDAQKAELAERCRYFQSLRAYVGSLVGCMRESGDGGSIINIASLAAVFGLPYGLDYVASKAAVIGMTRGMARELGPDHIRVNAVAPSAVMTEGTAEFFGEKFEKAKTVIAANQLIPRNLETADLTGTIIYLALHIIFISTKFSFFFFSSFFSSYIVTRIRII